MRTATEVEREVNPLRFSELESQIDKMLQSMAVKLLCEFEYREIALSIIVRQIDGIKDVMEE